MGLLVSHQRAVAGGIDVGEVGTQVLVYHHGALEELDAAVRQEGSVGLDADGEDHHIGREGPHAGLDGVHPAGAQNGLQGIAGEDPDALALEVTLDVLSHLGIKDIGHDLGGQIHHRDSQTLGLEILRRLQTDEAAAHYHGPAGLGGLHIVPQADGVVRGAQLEHALQVHAGQGRNDGRGAGGQDTGVIGVVLLLAGGVIAGSHRLGGAVQLYRLPAGEDLHAGETGEFGGGVDDQLLPGIDETADIIGQAASRIGDVLILGDKCDLHPAVHAFELGRGLGSGGDTADDEHLHNKPPSHPDGRQSLLCGLFRGMVCTYHYKSKRPKGKVPNSNKNRGPRYNRYHGPRGEGRWDLIRKYFQLPSCPCPGPPDSRGRQG